MPRSALEGRRGQGKRGSEEGVLTGEQTGRGLREKGAGGLKWVGESSEERGAGGPGVLEGRFLREQRALDPR